MTELNLREIKKFLYAEDSKKEKKDKKDSPMERIRRNKKNTRGNLLHSIDLIIFVEDGSEWYETKDEVAIGSSNETPDRIKKLIYLEDDPKGRPKIYKYSRQHKAIIIK